MAESGIPFFSEVIEKNCGKFRDDKDLLLLFIFWYLDGRNFVLLIANEQHSLLDRFKNDNNPNPMICFNKDNGKKISVLLNSSNDTLLVYFETYLKSPGVSRQIPLKISRYINFEKKEVNERINIIEKLNSALGDVTGEKQR